MSTKYVHFYYKTKPHTYLVFGPYQTAKNDVYDIEVCNDHVMHTTEKREWLFTATIDRDTHVVADMWKYINAYSANDQEVMSGCVVPSDTRPLAIDTRP